jgi:hypothetical protein
MILSGSWGRQHPVCSVNMCVIEFDFLLRSQVLAWGGVRTAALWDVGHCTLVEVDRRFRGAYCLHYQAILALTVVVRISETSALHPTKL